MASLKSPDLGLVSQMEKYLRDHPSLNAGTKFPHAAQSSHPVGWVPSNPQRWCQPNRCWFNVLAAVGAGKGSAVYGWAFWPDVVVESRQRRDVILAQHHAVLCDENGSLVDITPHKKTFAGPSILFMGDARVGFDLDVLAQPMLLSLDVARAQTGDIEMTWRDFYHKRLPHPPGLLDNFAVGRM